MRSSVITVKSLTVFGGLFALIVVIIVEKELFSTICVRLELAKPESLFGKQFVRRPDDYHLLQCKYIPGINSYGSKDTR
jgi:hypothetical protein